MVREKDRKFLSLGKACKTLMGRCFCGGKNGGGIEEREIFFKNMQEFLPLFKISFKPSLVLMHLAFSQLFTYRMQEFTI